MTRRIPWWAVRIIWSAGWVGFSLIYLLRDIHTSAGVAVTAFQAIIFLFWSWLAYCDIHRWNRKGTDRYLSVKRRNRDE
jgi:hypothetical protein